jgi:histidine ammonia-lyase
MTLVLDGSPIGPADVAAVAAGAAVAVDPARLAWLGERHAIVEDAAAAGAPVYGLTTGVGPMRDVPVAADAQYAFNDLLVRAHAVGHGPPLERPVVRAAMLARAQCLLQGGAGVAPAVVEALVATLADDDVPDVPAHGSLGQSDLAPLAAIGVHLVRRGLVLGPRDALALVNANGLSVGWACLAHEQAAVLLHALDASGALALEALVYNRNEVDEAVAAARPLPQLAETIARLRRLLAGGALLEGREPPRLFQDVLAARTLPQTHAALRAALAGLGEILAAELASAPDNPLLTPDGRLLSSVGNHDPSALAASLDHVRILVGHAITIASERVQKLLWREHSGLPTALRADASRPDDALAIYSQVTAALAAEVRLLAQPVSLELPSSSMAAGIEDRVTMAPVGARRLGEQADLGLRVAVNELTCAAQAVDLRSRAGALGVGTRAAYDLVRRHAAFVGPGEAPPADLDALVAEVAAGALP